MPRLRDITGNWFPDPVLLADVQGSGGVPSLKTVGKFGRNEAVDTITFQDVWSDDGNIIFLTSAETMDVVSSLSADDKDSGNGARAITIEGLDDNWNEISEYIQLEGVTPVTTTKSFIRINRAYIEEVGSGGVNAGIITIDATTSSTRQSSIQSGEGQTEKTQYTVPNGRTGYVTRFFSNVGKTDDVIIRIMVKEFGKGWRAKRILTLYQSHMAIPLNSYIKLPAKTDIKIEAKAVTSTTAVSAGYDLYITGR